MIKVITKLSGLRIGYKNMWGKTFKNSQKEPTNPEIYPGLNRVVQFLLLEHAPVISSLNHIVNRFHLPDFLNSTVCESAEKN